MISLINYDGGNISSIYKFLKKERIIFQVTNNYKEILESKKIILPGVSNFDYCIKALKKNSLDKAIKDILSTDKVYFLGICSGMQILTKYSEEGNHEGLGIINGYCKKFSFNDNTLVPHYGWNKVNMKKNALTDSILSGSRFYFCHKYYVVLEDPNNQIMTTQYSINFCSGLQKGKIYGVQFHPEKSSLLGIKLLKNFLKND